MVHINLGDKRSIRLAFPAGMLLLAMLFLSGISFAQTRGEVEVIKDPRIDTLIAHRLLAIKSSSAKFFISSDRNETYAKQAMFNQMYPELRTYIVYQEPNYKIKAGDFRSRLEAQKLIKDLRPQFPTLFIVSEKINPPKPDTSNDKN